MTPDHRRITLVCRSSTAPARSWLARRGAPCRLIFVHSFDVVPFALSHGVEELGRDVEGVILDGSATAVEYLHLLSSLPAAFAGDVMLILPGDAFLSAMGRGGNRVLYSLRPEDVEFYLRAKMLVLEDPRGSEHQSRTVLRTRFGSEDQSRMDLALEFGSERQS